MIGLILIIALLLGIQVGIFVSVLQKIGNQAERIADRMNDVDIIENANVCNHELAPCEYYYDDDWGHIGREIFANKRRIGYLCCCKKCGALFVDWNIKDDESGEENV